MSKRAAEQFFQAGQWREASQQAAIALQQHPGDVPLLRILAASQAQLAEDARAAETYSALIAREPAVPEHWMNRATVRRALGQLELAEADYQRAADCGACDGNFHFNRGLLQLDLQNPVAAAASFALAHRAEPREAEFAFFYAETLFTLLRLDAALTVAQQWRQWDNLSVALLPRLGNLLFQLGAASDGERVLNLALLMEPDDEDSCGSLIGLLERSNRLDEAETHWRRLIALPSANSESQAARDLLGARLAQRRGEHAQAAALFQSARQGSANLARGADLLFGLAKSQDAIQDSQAAWASLQLAHAAQLQEIASVRPRALAETRPFEIADYSVQVEDRCRWFVPTANAENPSPLFVVAFPRSGTTLLEQMLDAHPAMGSMDEQPFLQLAIDDIQKQGGRYPDSLASLGAEDHALVRARYFERVASRVQLSAGQRLVDKNPLNLLRLPAIHWLFPDAPVVLVLRHPCDVLLSCHMQQFRAPEFAVLCRSLESLAQGYVRAFDFFYAQQSLLGARVLEVRYEALVSDVEAGTRRLCAFAGLPWHAAMLDPAAHALGKAYISTPSYTQVVKPVSRGAVNRWRRYESFFRPVMPILQPYLDRWGYEGL